MPSNSAALLYLHRTGFELFSPVFSQTISFPFSDEAEKYMEINSAETLKTQLKAFLEQLNVKDIEVYVMLSEEVVFHKIITETEQPKQQEAIAKFTSEVPFEPKDIGSGTWLKDGVLHAFGVNKKLYEIFIPVFTSLTWKLTSVVPLFMFYEGTSDPNQFLQKATLADDEAMNYLQNAETWKNENFLVKFPLFVAPVTPGTSIEQKASPQQKKIATTVLVGVIILIWIVMGFFVINSLKPKAVKKTTSLDYTSQVSLI
jgi:hypothetical protein